MFSHCKAVIFDCDGVLVDSETVSNRVLAENLTRHGLPMTLERSMELFVGGTMNLVWIAGLTALVLMEKVLPRGQWVATTTGLALLATGFMLLL